MVGQMCRMPKRHPSFFKVLIGDYTERLRIPPAFVKYLKVKSCKEFNLKTDAGKLWVVKMERIDEYYFLNNGWTKFVEDCRLKFGDFLVFSLISDSTFDVVTYGRTGCLKNVDSALKKYDVALTGQNKGNQCDCEDGHTTIVPYKKPCVSGTNVKPAGLVNLRHPSFAMIMKKHIRYRIDVPKGFATETGMVLNRKAVLRDAEGRKWPVVIHTRKSQPQKRNAMLRIELGNGWSEFQKAKKLAQGDACLFEFIPNKEYYVLDVRIRRNGGSGAVVAIN